MRAMLSISRALAAPRCEQSLNFSVLIKHLLKFWFGHSTMLHGASATGAIDPAVWSARWATYAEHEHRGTAASFRYCWFRDLRSFRTVSLNLCREELRQLTYLDVPVHAPPQ